MNLQQQLEYIYDRGYWSIVKNRTRGHYFMVSTKDEYGKLHCHGYAETKELATKYSHAFTLDNFLRGEDIENLEIVDTIHPSELMGKGFQVGDRVLLITGNGTTKESVVTNVANGGDGNRYELKCYPHVSFPHMRLKPVLPVEEKKVCVICKQQETREGSNLFCKDCIQQVLKEMPTKDDKNACEMCGHGTEIGFTTKDFETYIKVNGYIRMLEQGDKEQQAEARKIKKKKGKDGHIVNL